MVRMVIAEDEPIIRDGLVNMPWKEIGVELVGVATNGLEALDLLQKASPQLLFTDIKMPGIDGLELIELAQKMISDIQSVILTGYSNFEYAHKAISLSALDYVLKPSDSQVILKAIQKAVNKIENENLSKHRQNELSNELNRNKKQLFESFLLKAISTNILQENVSNDLIRFEIDDGEFIIVALHSNDETITDEIRQKAEIILNEACLNCECPFPWFVTMDEKTLLLIFHQKICIPDFLQAVRIITVTLLDALETKSSLKLQSCISLPLQRFHELNTGYLQVMQCLNLFFSRPQKKIMCFDDVNTQLNVKDAPADITKDIFNYFKEKNYSGLENSLQALQAYYRDEALTEERFIKYVYIDICISSLRIMADQRIVGQIRLEPKDYVKINEALSLDSLSDYVKIFLWKGIDCMNARQSMPVKKVVEQVQAYIEKNYMNDISLTQTAQEVHLNPGYLSRLLKKQLNVTFMQLLTNTRMGKACELLGNLDIMIYEVSERVGIEDFRYFGQIFKNKYSMTPSEYRRILISQKNQEKTNG
ncbi:MAG: response regulator transcription factor [Ruminiclostridium sp.]